MRAVIQRVSRASVTVEGKLCGAIEKGLLILLGVGSEDTEADGVWLANKILSLRIFNDEKGAMNLSLGDAGGDILLISQFTLFAGTKKGARPSFIAAAHPSVAEPLYLRFREQLQKSSACKIEMGVFGADMKVELLNDGPVTIIIDTKNKE